MSIQVNKLNSKVLQTFKKVGVNPDVILKQSLDKASDLEKYLITTAKYLGIDPFEIYQSTENITKKFLINISILVLIIISFYNVFLAPDAEVLKLYDQSETGKLDLVATSLFKAMKYVLELTKFLVETFPNFSAAIATVIIGGSYKIGKDATGGATFKAFFGETNSSSKLVGTETALLGLAAGLAQGLQITGTITHDIVKNIITESITAVNNVLESIDRKQPTKVSLMQNMAARFTRFPNSSTITKQVLDKIVVAAFLGYLILFINKFPQVLFGGTVLTTRASGTGPTPKNGNQRLLNMHNTFMRSIGRALVNNTTVKNAFINNRPNIQRINQNKKIIFNN